MATKKATGKTTSKKGRAKVAKPSVRAQKSTSASKKSAEELSPQEQLKHTLVKMRHDLLEENREELAKYISGENRQLVDSGVDSGDSMGIDLSEDLRMKIFGSNNDVLKKLDESLIKIEEGTYGSCDECGEDINPERLRILPFAIRCRDCQEDAEEREA